MSTDAPTPPEPEADPCANERALRDLAAIAANLAQQAVDSAQVLADAAQATLNAAEALLADCEANSGGPPP